MAVSTLAFAAYLVLSAVPAQAAVSCLYDAVNKEANVTLSAAADAATIEVGAGGAIDVNAAQCGVATVNNTDGINITDTSGGIVDVTIDLRGGPFAPGETPEATGTSEIEFNLLAPGFAVGDDLFIQGSDINDTIIGGNAGTGAWAFNLNGDADADITSPSLGIDSLGLFGNGGDDLLDLRGGSGTGSFHPDVHGFGGTGFLGGEGNDSIFTGDALGGNATVDGQQGNDHLVSGAGGDILDDNGTVNVDCDGVAGVGAGDAACDDADTLEGGGGGDSLTAGDGNDLLNGGSGDDFENGQNHDDVYDQESGPNGNDNLDESGTGTDTADYSGRNSNLNLINDDTPVSGETGVPELDDIDSDIEVLLGGSANDTITDVTGGSDTLVGNGGNDTLTADGGDDTLFPGEGNDSANGGTESDTVNYSDVTGPVTVDLAAGTSTGAGTDTLALIESAVGTTGGDTLLGSAAANTLTGGAGNDTIDGREGDDTMLGGAGDDTITDSGVDPTNNDDTAKGGEGNDAITTGVGDDEGDGGLGADTIDTGAGDDDAFGDCGFGCPGGSPPNPTGHGNDVIETGPGDDGASGQGGDDVVSDHDDPLVPEDDFVGGGPGNDTLSADFGDDTFLGGGEDDTITSGEGDDSAEGDCSGGCTVGGDGDDTFTDTGTDPTNNDDTFDGEQGSDTATGGVGDDVLRGDAAASAKDGADDLDGGEGEDDVRGDGGSDNVRGGAGNDIVCGDDCSGTLLGDGSDKVEGGLGDDTLVGGQGADQLVYKHAPSGVEVDASLGFARGGDGNDAFAGPAFDFEIVGGSLFGDVLTGGNSLFIQGANFRLVGLAGDDLLTGSSGNDTLKAGKGDDELFGLGGADVLRGAGGFDAGNGGRGPDTCKSIEAPKSC